MSIDFDLNRSGRVKNFIFFYCAEIDVEKNCLPAHWQNQVGSDLYAAAVAGVAYATADSVACACTDAAVVAAEAKRGWRRPRDAAETNSACPDCPNELKCYCRC